MPNIDFSKIDDVQDFSPIPEGKYVCQISEIEISQTQYNDELWKLRLEVVKGEYQGRIIFDNLVFSEGAMKRVKFICSRLGIDVSGKINLTPELIKNRICSVSVLTEKYEDSDGNIKKRNIVPFAGYERINEDVIVHEQDDSFPI